MSSFKQFKKLFISTPDPPNSFSDVSESMSDVVRGVNTLQNNISDAFIPIIAKSQNDSNILTNITLLPPSSLPSGHNYNIINHGLGKTLSGWKIVRKRAASDIYDVQDNNNQPSLTLWLVSSQKVVVDLEVF